MNLKSMVFASLLVLAACGKSDDAEVVPQDGNNTQNADVGPFTVAFSAENETYQHSFKGVPTQSEGKVEYFITLQEAAKIQFVSTEVKVTGCSASQVSHQTFWVPDAAKTEGQITMPGLSFEPKVGQKGVLLHILKGLDGCSQVELSTSLKRSKIIKPNPGFPVGGICEGTQPQDGCKVQVYCREQDPLSTYVETEVWKRSWGLDLRKYMKHSDGTRGLMASAMVNTSTGAGSTTYGGGGLNLVFNNTTGIGTLKENLGGQTFTTDLDCTWL